MSIDHHTERCLEAIRWAQRGRGWALLVGRGTLGAMVDTLAYDHARKAARIARTDLCLRPPSLFAKAIRWAEGTL